MGKNKQNFKKKKAFLAFDESKRREFLTGFHKRKLQRKKKAQEELQKQLKEEKKRLKQEAKENFKKLTLSHKPIPELEQYCTENYEDNEVSVEIIDLAPKFVNSSKNENTTESEAAESDDENSETNQSDEIEGMELKIRKKPAKVNEPLPDFKTEKDVKKLLKKKATKNVQKSKAFKMKYAQEKQKMKKKSMQQKRLRLKSREKKGKRKIK